MLSSPTPQFCGFAKGEDENSWKLIFGKYDDNQKGIQDIQSGILSFVMEYKRQFHKTSFMYNISGRDAYAPMLLAAGKRERYLKEIEKRFHFDANV